jgi:iron complex transport system substrate-binding protein
MKICLFTLLLTIALAANSCHGNRETLSAGELKDSSSILSRAERFSVEKADGYTRITIFKPWQGSGGLNLTYHLVRRGSALPPGHDSSTVIFVPLKKIICMSTTHLAMISALEEENSVAGVSGLDFIYSDILNRRVKNGYIEDVGYDAGLNKELILNISPDLIMMYGIGSESAGYVGKIKELGVKVMYNADYLETDPLGKAEWIKLFGALYCKENKADSIFRSEVESYNRIKTFIREKTTQRPKVMLGLPFKDTWYISPGNSFISKMIEDAGGDYIWKKTSSSVSMPYGIENVYMGALNADFWLNAGTANNKEEIAVVDNRLTELPPFKKGNLYNNNKRVSENGGNDYWETGSLFPHLILMDVASILHPELFEDNELFFYKKIY